MPDALPTQPMGPIDVIATSASEASSTLIAAALAGRAAHAHLVNAYTIALADRDQRYRNALSDSSCNFPDGKPLSWVSRLRRDSPRITQVRGPSLFHAVIRDGLHQGLTHYLLGSSPATLALLEANLRDTYPGVSIVGRESPPFREPTQEELEARDAKIRQSGAAVVWIGLGTPKQDFEARRVSESTGTLAIAVGAAFDFTAGTTREAPRWMTAAGVEWLYRLVTEPRRLWKRYLIGNPAFIWAIIRRRNT